MLNTCSVRENANEKVYNRIHRIKQGSKNGPVKVGVLGCMATNFKKNLLENKRLGIDFIAGPDSYKKLPHLIENSSEKGLKPFDVTLSEFETYSDVLPIRKPGINAWIAVMRGCDNFCTFCVVPFTRGRERSRSVSNVIEEVESLAYQGFKQVTLLGQNVNSYQHENYDFAYLLEKVSEVEGIERIRFTSPHPKDFPRELLEVVARNPKVCKHIHLPLQAGNDRVLQMMNRTYTQKEYLSLVDEIRNLNDEIALTTDIIVGFPTEAHDEFLDTYNVMKKVKYDSAFIFKYSERKGTTASKKFADDVLEEDKKTRIISLNELQRSSSLERNLAESGKVLKVLIEEVRTKKSDQDFQGRTDQNKIVIFPKGDFKKGDFVHVKIEDASPHVLRGYVINN